MFSERLNSKSKTVSGLGRQTVPNSSGSSQKDRSAKAEWARFTMSSFWFSEWRFLDGVYG